MRTLCQALKKKKAQKELQQKKRKMKAEEKVNIARSMQLSLNYIVSSRININTNE